MAELYANDFFIIFVFGRITAKLLLDTDLRFLVWTSLLVVLSDFPFSTYLNQDALHILKTFQIKTLRK
jgi:hypothetical protein